jgi:hypothetical protein
MVPCKMIQTGEMPDAKTVMLLYYLRVYDVMIKK